MILRIASAAFLLMMLTACGDDGSGELKTWMEQVKKETAMRVPPVAEPKLFVPANYESGDLIDPFDSSKLSVVFARMKAANDNGLKPDFDRPKEALEGYPLESMTMVGTIENKKVLHALVQIEKAVYPVVVGAYIGLNFGKVVRVTDTRIELLERVQDSSGEWTERKASLELQEAKK